jgi:imidazolonepropionase-like amidohydrolase
MDPYLSWFIGDYGNRNGWHPNILRKSKATFEAKSKGLARAVKAGVKLSFGTDAGVYPHGDNARQFKYYVDLGMTPMQAIQSATTVAAEHLGWQADVGSLTPGHWADMVAVSRDPLADITALEKVSQVIKGGEIVR